MFLFLPVRDEYGVKRFPVVVLLIILANCGIYFAFAFSPEVYKEIVLHYGFTPARFAPVTLLTSLFLHGGLFHLASNMWFLWLMGDNLEDRWGRVQFLLFYLTAGIFSSLLYSVMIPEKHTTIPTIGASGAISGVMGAYAVLFPRSRITFKYLAFFLLFFRWGEFELYASLWLALWFIQQAIYSYLVAREIALSSVAFAAHFAGFVFGAIVAIGVRLFQEARHRSLVETGRYALQEFLGPAVQATKLLGEVAPDLRKIEEEMEEDRVGASELYEKLLQLEPLATLPEKVQFQLAQSLERQGKRDSAITAYKNFIRSYPCSKLADNALFTVGKYLLEKGDYEGAKNALRQIVIFYPYSDIYEEAKYFLEKELPERIASGFQHDAGL
ncbi:MAG: rhomboid family intramembrane serine protease [Candidatus Omnitrophica bacterium]|nr:rhomboid family intramembrane serine protease [Candidatus Omnitrophota bacterium]